MLVKSSEESGFRIIDYLDNDGQVLNIDIFNPGSDLIIGESNPYKAEGFLMKSNSTMFIKGRELASLINVENFLPKDTIELKSKESEIFNPPSGRVIYRSIFQTSRFNTFEEKIASFGDELFYRLTHPKEFDYLVPGEVQRITAHNRRISTSVAVEAFDVFEIYGQSRRVNDRYTVIIPPLLHYNAQYNSDPFIVFEDFYSILPGYSHTLRHSIDVDYGKPIENIKRDHTDNFDGMPESVLNMDPYTRVDEAIALNKNSSTSDIGEIWANLRDIGLNDMGAFINATSPLTFNNPVEKVIAYDIDLLKDANLIYNQLTGQLMSEYQSYVNKDIFYWIREKVYAFEGLPESQLLSSTKDYLDNGLREEFHEKYDFRHNHFPFRNQAEVNKFIKDVTTRLKYLFFAEFQSNSDLKSYFQKYYPPSVAGTAVDLDKLTQDLKAAVKYAISIDKYRQNRLTDNQILAIGEGGAKFVVTEPATLFLGRPTSALVGETGYSLESYENIKTKAAEMMDEIYRFKYRKPDDNGGKISFQYGYVPQMLSSEYQEQLGNTSSGLNNFLPGGAFSSTYFSGRTYSKPVVPEEDYNPDESEMYNGIIEAIKGERELSPSILLTPINFN